jgi:hypothetical protein
MTRSATHACTIVSMMAALSGCDSLPSFDRGLAVATTPVASAPAAPPPAPSDLLMIFIAAAGPGSSGMVNGQSVRVARAYTAASGRDCREVLLGSGLGERSAVACLDPIAGWSLARPLLQGSGIGRP